MLLTIQHREPRIEFALAAGLVLYGAGRAGHLTDWLRWRPLMYLGRTSYRLHLIHYSVMHLVVHAGHRLTGDPPGAAFGWTALALVLSLLAAHVLNVLVEAPTARLSSRLKQRPSLTELAALRTPMAAIRPHYRLARLDGKASSVGQARRNPPSDCKAKRGLPPPIDGEPPVHR